MEDVDENDELRLSTGVRMCEVSDDDDDCLIKEIRGK
jgi:hypothetical protein